MIANCELATGFSLMMLRPVPFLPPFILYLRYWCFGK